MSNKTPFSRTDPFLFSLFLSAKKALPLTLKSFHSNPRPIFSCGMTSHSHDSRLFAKKNNCLLLALSFNQISRR